MEYNKNAVDRVEFLCYFGEVTKNYYGAIIVGRLRIVSRRRWNENRDEQKQSLFLHGIKSTEFAYITTTLSYYDVNVKLPYKLLWTGQLFRYCFARYICFWFFL